MLYDIVSPTLFFLSLGGIILITGRVVIRIRRQQFTDSIQAEAQAGTVTAPLGRLARLGDMSPLLQPSKKSVRVITSRVGLIRQYVQHQTRGARTWWQQRREKKTLLATPAVAAPVAETPVAPPSRVRQPLHQLRSLASSLRGLPARVRRARATQNEGAAAAESVPPLPETPSPAFSLKRSDDAASIPAPAATPAAPARDDTPRLSVTPVRQARSTGRIARRNLLLRHPHTTEENSPKASAQAALAAGHYQNVEDVMVTYIVKHPKDTEAYMLLGQAAMGRKAWAEAMEIFEQVISWNQAEPGAYAGLGTAAYQAGKFTRALQALQRAHDADPRDRTVLECLLAIAQKLDNHGLLHSLEQELKELPAAPVQPENARTPAR